MSICRPTRSLIKNIETLENDSLKLLGHSIPVVLSAHPYDFLDNIGRRIYDLENFIVVANEALNAEFVTLEQIRESYVDRRYSFEFMESKFVLTSNDLLRLAHNLAFFQKLLKKL